MPPGPIVLRHDPRFRRLGARLAGLILPLAWLLAVGCGPDRGGSGAGKKRESDSPNSKPDQAVDAATLGAPALSSKSTNHGDGKHSVSFSNSMGMRFVPGNVGTRTVLFSTRETRVRDYRVDATSEKIASTAWKDPMVDQLQKIPASARYRPSVFMILMARSGSGANIPTTRRVKAAFFAVDHSSTVSPPNSCRRVARCRRPIFRSPPMDFVSCSKVSNCGRGCRGDSQGNLSGLSLDWRFSGFS